MPNIFNLEGFSVDSDGKCTASGGFVGSSTIESGDTLSVESGGSLTTASGATTLLASSTIIMDALPTSDPVSAGQLWNSSGAVKVSSG